MSNNIRQITNWAKRCCSVPVIVMIIAACAMAVTFFAGFQPANLYYTAIFDKSSSKNAAVTFTFDRNQKYPSSSVQKTTVSDDGIATVFVDPLNYDSSSLKVTIDNPSAKLLSFYSHVTASNSNYTVTAFDVSALRKQKQSHSLTITLSSEQVSLMRYQARHKAPIRSFLLTIFFLIFVLMLLRISVWRKIAKGPFCVLAVVAVTTLFFVSHLPSSSFPYKRLIVGILCLFVVLLTVNLLAGQYQKKKAVTVSIILNYVCAALYAIAQFPMYVKYLQGFPDELAHISYIAYLQKTNSLIPDFADMQVYSQLGPSSLAMSSSENTFNYLGHPPLYYQLMRPFSVSHIDGTTFIYNATVMRCVSFGIGLLGLGVLFYIGATRIPRIPLLHLVYAMSIISPPMMVYGMSGVSNDTLALLTVSITLLGLIRFMEKKYTWHTYWLVAIGVSATLLTKLTAGLIVVIMCVLAVAYAIFTDKSPKSVLRPAFYITLPVYALPATYFALLYSKFHTIQPSWSGLDYASYVKSMYYRRIGDRSPMEIGDYVIYFFRQYVGSWRSVAGHVPVPGVNSVSFDLTTIGTIAVLLAPLCMLACWKTKDYMHRFLAFGAVALCVMLFVQMRSAMNGFYGNGYPGGFQSRYYLCAIGVFALSVIWLIKDNFATSIDGDNELESENAAQCSGGILLTPLGSTLCCAFVMLLLYDGFICSFLTHIPEILAQ